MRKEGRDTEIRRGGEKREIRRIELKLNNEKKRETRIKEKIRRGQEDVRGEMRTNEEI